MKTRLLKKIRKRYVITEVIELASNPSDVYEHCVEKYGLPFYVLSDNHDGWGFNTKFFKYIDEAKESLNEMILRHYAEKFRHKDAVTKKLWWVKK